MYVRSELGYHIDKKVEGANFCILQYPGKYCDVLPYCGDYEPFKVIPIVNATTYWKSPEIGQTYILFIYEAIWMGDTL